ncbi:50S ribosomal protein L1 [Candidatus Uhrbacteria bacterium]|nr:50S ribosomal protein L1 [Candidatus Uhrbacteria bacterium]
MPSKRFQAAKALIEKKKIYPITDAIALLKKTAGAKFNETVEVHFRLGIDPAKSDQQVRGTVALPHGTGKTKKVAAFVEAEKAAIATAAGADIVGAEDLIAEISKTNAIDFDVAVATPAMMPKLAKLAKLLGPRGLMPNPKTDTVGPNIEKIIKEQKAGKISFKNDTTSNIHTIFGRASFEEAQLVANLNAVIEAVRKGKPSTSKGVYMRTVTICTAMGPGIKVEVAIV